ncbi:MAG: hypothetical protein IV090_17120 [Candidatus Sericytochromatia bacterium]|nr:hypothetical protein [Candidatus Sericytochromatia bacterium]
MQTLLLFTAFLLGVTKLLDCLSTWQKLRHSNEETNGLFSHLMQRQGVGPAILLNFLLAMLIIIVFYYALLQQTLLMQWLSLPLIALVILVQAAVAHANATGQYNLITRHLRKMYVVIWKRH